MIFKFENDNIYIKEGENFVKCEEKPQSDGRSPVINILKYDNNEELGHQWIARTKIINLINKRNESLPDNKKSNEIEIVYTSQGNKGRKIGPYGARLSLTEEENAKIEELNAQIENCKNEIKEIKRIAAERNKVENVKKPRRKAIDKMSIEELEEYLAAKKAEISSGGENGKN